MPLLGDQVTASGDPGSLVVTAVAFNDGVTLNTSLVTDSTVKYATLSQPGLKLGLDASGQWFELGWEKYAYLMMLGWQAQVRVQHGAVGLRC